MIAKIIKNLHYFIFAVTFLTLWTTYNEHEEDLKIKKEQIPILSNQIKVIQKQKQEMATYLADIERAKDRIEKVAQEIESLQRKLPSNISDSDILVGLKGVAESLNIKNFSLSPQEEQNQGFYFSKSYAIKANGTFLQFLIFLEKIGESERILNVKSVQMTNADSDQRGRFQMVNASIVIEIYRYNPGYKEDRGLEDIKEKFGAL